MLRDGNWDCTDSRQNARYPELKSPKDLKTLRSFLGIANYYRQCMHGYSTVAEPLLELTHKDTPFQWDDRRQHAFEALKDKLVSLAVMAYPNVQIRIRYHLL